MTAIRPVSDLKNKFTEIELKLDEADMSAVDTTRYTEDEVFIRVRERIHEHEREGMKAEAKALAARREMEL